MEKNRIEQFFKQKVITIVGISSKEASLSYQVCKNIIEFNYSGKLQLVNPKGGFIFGHTVLKDIEKIESFGLVLVFLKHNLVVETMHNIARKGGNYFIIYSSGFAEVGQAGEEDNNKLKAIISKYNLMVIGPNCMGIVDNYANLYASNWFYTPKRGDIAFISQSGAYGMILSYMAKNKGLGFSKFISIGNCIDVSFAEILDYLYEDNSTKYIVLYIEGIINGIDFIQSLKRVAKLKRVFIIKSGNTSDGAQVTITHTGSKGIDFEVFKAVCDSTGAILIDDIEELINTLYLAHYYETINNNEITIISPSGGPCTIAADRCKQYGLELTRFSEDTTNRLKEILPFFANVNNPVDVTTLATSEESFEVVNTILRDAGVQIIVLMVFTYFLSEELKKTIATIRDKGKILICITLEEYTLGSAFQKLDVPLFFSINAAFKAIRNLISSKQNLIENNIIMQYELNEKYIIRHLKPGIYNEEKSKRILTLCGIKYKDEYVVRNEKELEIAWKKISKPICLKICEEKSIHKTEISGVKKNIVDFEEAKKLFTMWKEQYSDDVKAIISRMRDCECQFFISIKRNLNWGYVFIIGIGGVMINEINYKKIFLLPESRFELEKILEEELLQKFYVGFRKQYRLDKQKLLLLIEKLVLLIKSNKQIDEVEINPLMLDKEDIYIADALIVVGKGEKNECYTSKN